MPRSKITKATDDESHAHLSGVARRAKTEGRSLERLVELSDASLGTMLLKHQIHVATELLRSGAHVRKGCAKGCRLEWPCR